ncbi:MAG: helix-turn-helix domain-containing protein [Pseudonocardiaceae bacterium]
MDNEEARTIGRRVKQIRYARGGKSLRVIAGLAGMSKDTLSRIERGERPLDSRSETVALADALGVAPSELTRQSEATPVNGDRDAAVHAVRLALRAAIDDVPGGLVLPAEVLRDRVTATVDALCRCEREREVGVALPGFIRDLHTSIADGRDVPKLLDLAVLLHTQVTIPWLRLAGAPLDLSSHPLSLARQAARERGTAAPLGLAAAAGARVMLAEGAFDLARAGLDAVATPTNTPGLMQVAGFLALFQSLVAAADKREADVDAALEHAGELAERTGEGNAYGLGFGPTNVGLWRMAAALRTGDPERAATIAEGIRSELPPNRCRQAAYWTDYGRAASRLPGRHNDAVMAFCRVEKISPYRVQRNPVVHNALAELLPRVRRDSPAGRELRRMAYRAGLPA